MLSCRIFNTYPAMLYPPLARLRCCQQAEDLVLKGSPQVVFEIISTWYNSIVMAYTKCQLTQPKDRLPAVSALAKFTHEVVGAKYHAGLLLHTIQFGLCWNVT